MRICVVSEGIMSFNNLIGNEEIKQILQNAVKSNTISHSYMFIGQVGIGKTLFAKEFAKMILCEDNTNDKPCNKCKSCIEMENNNNPDFTLIQPIDTKIKIEQIRELQSKILEKPIISNKKVYVIKEADTMTQEASNCLLKTLEEPPEYITIILIGANESMFLNTIRSRCTKILFRKINDEILKKFLEDRYNFQNINNNMLKVFDGSIQKAISINEKHEVYEELERVFSNIEKLGLLDVLNKIDCLYKNKEDIYEILDYINVILFNKSIKNPKYLKYIEVVEQTKKSLKLNSNYDMCIDNLLYQIWEE